MEESKTKHRPQGLHDPDRAAYMIAWRDQHIAKQNELIRGYEENLSLMEALLAFALWQGAEQCGAERLAHVPKGVLGEMLGRYTSEVREQGEEFTVRFSPVQEPIDGGEQGEG